MINYFIFTTSFLLFFKNSVTLSGSERLFFYCKNFTEILKPLDKTRKRFGFYELTCSDNVLHMLQRIDNPSKGKIRHSDFVSSPSPACSSIVFNISILLLIALSCSSPTLKKNVHILRVYKQNLTNIFTSL